MENISTFFSSLIYFTEFQLVIAALLGMILGIERTLAGKVAGMRTYALVSLGACLLVIISEIVVGRYADFSVFDPLRLAAAIVMGIGFIAGGAVFMREDKVSGLTTAAGIWLATAIGIAVGFGLFSIAIFTSLLTLFIFRVMWYLEDRVRHSA